MPASTSTSFLRRPSSAALLILIAATVWGITWWQQSRVAPVQARIEAGARQLQQGQGTAAEREWKEAVRIDPQNAEAWELLSDYYLTVGNAKNAREAFEHILKLRPQTPEIHYHLAVCSAQLGDVPAARRHAEKQLKLDDSHVGSLEILVDVLTQTGEAEANLPYMRRMAELQPQNDLYLSRWANALMVQKHYAEARPVLDKLLKLKPGFGRAYSMRGAALFYTDTSPQGLTQATQDLTEALRQDPHDVVAGLYLGKVYLRLRKPREAIVTLRKLERLRNAPTAYLFELAKAHQMMGDSQKALAIRRRYAAIERQHVTVERLESRLANNPRDFNTILALGVELLRSHKPVGAERYLNKAAQMQPKNARAKKALQQLEVLYAQHLRAGMLALERRSYDKVGSHLSQAMMLRPYDRRTAKALQQFQSVAGINASASTGAKPSKSADRSNLPPQSKYFTAPNQPGTR